MDDKTIEAEDFKKFMNEQIEILLKVQKSTILKEISEWKEGKKKEFEDFEENAKRDKKRGYNLALLDLGEFIESIE